MGINKINIIAEVGSVHDGSIGNAIKLVSLASRCGANTVKFQTHIADAETLRNAPMPKFFTGEPRYEYFERTGFTFNQWKDIIEKCKDEKIGFLSSPFSIEAVELLESLGIEMYKIPSGEVTNIPLLKAIAETKKPVILSSGMSNWEELDAAVKIFKKSIDDITVLQCTSMYPCDYKNVGLNIIQQMKDRYNLPVGFSDHTMTNYAAFVAVSLGASVIEKHLTFSRDMYGSDAKHSSEPSDFIDLIDGVRAIETMISSETDKDQILNKMVEMKSIFEKSIVSLVDIPKNTIISDKMIGFKKPGTGIPTKNFNEIIGMRSKKDIKKDMLIRKDDLTDA